MSFYVDPNHKVWVENYVFKLPSGEIVAVYNDYTKEKTAELALRKTHQQLRAVFDAIPGAICVIDKSYKLLDVNRKFLEYFKLPDYASAISKVCFDIIRKRPTPLRNLRPGPDVERGQAVHPDHHRGGRGNCRNYRKSLPRAD